MRKPVNFFQRLVRRTDEIRTLNPGCTELEIEKWSVSKFVVDRLVPVVGFHPFPLDELMLMTAAVAVFRPSHVFEWGTHIGKSARAFHEISKAFGLPVEIHSIDLPDDADHAEHPRHKRGKYVKDIPCIILHHGDGLDTSLRIYEREKYRIRLPLFFLDGDHSYESIKSELHGIRSKASNAVLLVHDTFYQSEESGYNTGPYRAINEMMDSVPGDYSRISTSLGLPGMTLLFRKNRAPGTEGPYRNP
jgi:cephalosporin hydroxylase